MTQGSYLLVFVGNKLVQRLPTYLSDDQEQLFAGLCGEQACTRTAHTATGALNPITRYTYLCDDPGRLFAGLCGEQTCTRTAHLPL